MKVTALLVVSVLVCGPAFGQSIGANLAGVVTDETGAQLQDTTIALSIHSDRSCEHGLDAQIFG